MLLWLRELWAALLIQYLLKLSHFLHTEEAMVVGNKIRLTAHAFTDPDGHPDRQEQWEGWGPSGVRTCQSCQRN